MEQASAPRQIVVMDTTELGQMLLAFLQGSHQIRRMSHICCCIAENRAEMVISHLPDHTWVWCGLLAAIKP